MNYDQARQLADGGWHWTSMNDGYVRTAWPCKRPADGVTFRLGTDMSLGKTPISAWKAGAIVPDDAAWITCEPHATREDAERHYYDASLEGATTEYAISWMACAVPECPEPTTKMLGNVGQELFNGDPLCDAHRTREQLAALHPFAPGLALIHS